MKNPTLKSRPVAGRSNGDDSQPWYAHRWPWFLMLGPALVIVAGAITIWLAVTRPDALVVDDYYKQGQAINQDLRRDAQAAHLKMQLRLIYNPASGKLAGVITSGAGATAQTIQLHLIHPTLPENDMTFKAQTDDAGQFEIPLPMLQMAHWQIEVEDQQHSWRLAGAWAWPQQKKIEINADTESAG
jgi:uncharacterized protein